MRFFSYLESELNGKIFLKTAVLSAKHCQMIISNSQREDKTLFYIGLNDVLRGRYQQKIMHRY
ncbi:Uncharacterised protein [Yersinia aldovae]|nr:Uncharacterised protein [Yersinia aldovae]